MSSRHQIDRPTQAISGNFFPIAFSALNSIPANRLPSRRFYAGRAIPRWLMIVGGLVLVLIVCEALGWPFLVKPLEGQLSKKLQREVTFSPTALPPEVVALALGTPPASPGSAASAASAPAAVADNAVDPNAPTRTRIHLLGRLRLKADALRVAAPSWSKDPYFVDARGLDLAVPYSAIWQAMRGEVIHIVRLHADQLNVIAQRTKDGKASWQFSDTPPEPKESNTKTELPRFDSLIIKQGQVVYRDLPLVLDLDARIRTNEGSAKGSPAGAATTATSATSTKASASSSSASAGTFAAPAGDDAPGLVISTTGHYKKGTFSGRLSASGALPLLGGEQEPVPLQLGFKSSETSFDFLGQAANALALQGITGKFKFAGPSLGDISELLDVTLPTTGPFNLSGSVQQSTDLWKVVVDDATVGQSKLQAEMQYDSRGAKPLLAGKLVGQRVLLADLAPSIGASGPSQAEEDAKKKADREANATSKTTAATHATPAAQQTPTAKTGAAANAAKNAANAKAAADTNAKGSSSASGRVLPDKEFDLPSLRAMNANILLDVQRLELGKVFAEPLTPLRAQLTLTDGVLAISQLDAQTAGGRLRGGLSLDGTGSTALWKADLRWTDVLMERWLKQTRSDGAPPFLTGRLNGRANVTGQGRSTGAILGSLQGTIGTSLREGSVSHLIVEAAGIDIAQALGVFVKGDDSLPVSCGVADFRAEKGVLFPRAVLLDTKDSTVVVDGTVSLVDEKLDLRGVVAPKDFSPLALRAPILVKGSFGSPSVSLEASKLAPKAGMAALLALVAPIAAIIPLIDTGDGNKGSGCEEFLARRSAEGAGVAMRGNPPATAAPATDASAARPATAPPAREAAAPKATVPNARSATP